uniref:Uncharacterized protein n=1 Tax=Sarcophilus harrisii TaxID=9305 RepID=A0A7N4NT81_SARHA
DNSPLTFGDGTKLVVT